MKPLNSIDTWWNGLYFRSRLEARWAVFYDELGIAYEYEKEGYDLGNGVFYLPDFWFPDFRFYVEIKGEKPQEEDVRKMEKLAIHSGCRVFLAVGQMLSSECKGYPNEHECCSSFEANGIITASWDYNYHWCRCRCGKYGLEFGGRNDRICRHDKGDRWHDTSQDEIAIAYAIARATRFEDVYKPIWKTHKDPITGYVYAEKIKNGNRT